MWAHHDPREVDCGGPVQDEEQGGRGQGPEAGHQACGHEQGGCVQVREVAGPGRGLVLADAGDDGDVLAGVGGVQQAQAAACICTGFEWLGEGGLGVEVGVCG